MPIQPRIESSILPKYEFRKMHIAAIAIDVLRTIGHSVPIFHERICDQDLIKKRTAR